jgi:hypothetical protein
MLALCEALGMKIHFVAPAFGFQKNMPYPDNAALRALIEKQWAVCRQFGVSIGFHSGSGKSAENYQVMGSVTGQPPRDQDQRPLHLRDGPRALRLVRIPPTRRSGATGIVHPRARPRRRLQHRRHRAEDGARLHHRRARQVRPRHRQVSPAPTATPRRPRVAAAEPEHMFWFEYNFLYVLAAGGRAEKAALGDHTPAGYQQRARFYGVSAEGRLLFARASPAT